MFWVGQLCIIHMGFGFEVWNFLFWTYMEISAMKKLLQNALVVTIHLTYCTFVNFSQSSIGLL